MIIKSRKFQKKLLTLRGPYCRRSRVWALGPSSGPHLDLFREAGMRRELSTAAGFMLQGVLLLIGIFGLRLLSYGQVNSGTILGTVKDQSGAVVPNATVILTNQGTNATIQTSTAENGTYVFTPIRIGIYTVSVQFRGFRKETHPNIQVSTQQQVVVDFILTPGETTQTIQVTAAPPALQTESASVGQVMNRSATNDLPLNGRNYTFLAQLTAGVTKMQQDSRGLSQSGGFAANGQRSAQNNYLLDGISNNNNSQDFLNGAYYVVQPPVDAIQEFKAETSDYSAQLGRSAGAVLNATVRSGTNQLHGDAWEFFRNDRLDAADFFENAGGIKKGAFRQNQFGFTFGGPIKKNRTFFFGDYEGTRNRQGIPFSGTVPTLAERASGFTDFSDLIKQQGGTLFSDNLGRAFPQGTVFDPATTRPVTAGQNDPVTGLKALQTGFVRDPFLNNIIPIDRIDPNAVALLNLLPPPTSSGLFTNFTRSPGQKRDSDDFDIRVDHKLTEEDQLFGRFSFNKQRRLVPGPFPGLADGGSFNQESQTVKTFQIALGETHTFSPTLVNEARAGFDRVKTLFTQPFADQLGIAQQFGIQGVPQVGGNGGLPQISISGIQPFGAPTFQPDDEFDQTSQVTDDLTKVYGNHTFKGGFEYQRLRNATLQPGFPRGFFNFSGVYTSIPNVNVGNTGRAQFVLSPSKATVPNGIDFNGGPNGVQISNTAVTDDHRNYYAAYAQDGWKATPKLTVTYGVRWEFFGPLDEKNGKQANLDLGKIGVGGARYLIPVANPTLSPSFLALLKTDGIGLVTGANSQLVDPENYNFGPRFGIAYHVLPKLVARAGYGIFYGGFENVGFGPNLGRNFPFQFTFNFTNPNATSPIAFANGANATFETSLLNIPLEASQLQAKGLSVNGIQQKFGSANTQSTNFTLEYQFSPTITGSVGYVGSFTRKLNTFVPTNPVTALLTRDTKFTPFLAFPDLAPGGAFQATEGNSYYNGLQINVQERGWHGLNYLANFTYSQCRSDARDTLNNTTGGFRAAFIPGAGIKQDYGLCDIHIRRVFHFSGGWELPVGHGKPFLTNAGGIADRILGEWSLHWILTAQDGQPFTIPCNRATSSGSGCFALLVPGQDLFGGKTPDHFLNPKGFKNPPPVTQNGQSDLAPLGGSPTQVTGPPFRRLDLSIFKQIRVSERTHFEFRAEFFNITNTPNFSTVQGPTGGTALVTAPGALDFNNPNFGRITSTVDIPNDPREIQFALKFYF